MCYFSNTAVAYRVQALCWSSSPFIAPGSTAEHDPGFKVVVTPCPNLGAHRPLHMRFCIEICLVALVTWCTAPIAGRATIVALIFWEQSSLVVL